MAAASGKAIPSEDQEQAWLVAWFRRHHPGLLIFAIPNGGHRHKATAALLKATGVAPGVPDLFIPEPRGGRHGLFVEMKRTKGGSLSPEQKAWLDALSARGYLAIKCAGFEAAKAAIAAYLEHQV